MGPELIAAQYWFSFWEWIGDKAFLIVVVALAIEFLAARWAKPHRELLDHAKELQVAQLTRDAEASKAAIAGAEARAAEATQKATEAQLALEKFKAPRTIAAADQEVMISALKPFAPQEYALSVGEGQEPSSLLCLLDSILEKAGWTKINHFGMVQVDTPCGVVAMNSLSDVHIRVSPDAPPFTPGAGTRAAVTLLAAMLNALGIAAFPAQDPKNIPKANAINLMVGVKQ